MEFKIITDLAPIEAFEIQTNAEALEKEIAEKVAVYRTMAVTPETKAAARQDLANLRKAVAAIDQTYTAARAILLRPAEGLKGQRERLKAILNEAISNLDTQVKGFDEQEAQEKIDQLHAFFDGLLTDETREFADWERIRNPRWRNKTYDMTQAQNEIHVALGEIERSLAALRGYQEPYKSPMLVKFRETGRLDDTINVFTQIKRREATEAELRRRKEEEARRAAEEAERQKKMAVTDRRYTEGGDAQAARAAQELSDSIQSEFTRAAENSAQGNKSGETAAPAPIQRPNAQRKIVEFRVVADSASAKALGAFLRGNGIGYEILRFKNEGDETWTVPAKR